MPDRRPVPSRVLGPGPEIGGRTGQPDRAGQPDAAGQPDRTGQPDARASATGQPDATSPAGPSGRSGKAGRDGQRAASATVHLRVDLDALRRARYVMATSARFPAWDGSRFRPPGPRWGYAITDLVITNGVDVTTVCHLGRSVPAPLKTALIERDGSCAVPGCDVTRGLEIDHWRIAFADGGPASLENLARLCAHHHYLRTHKGFQLRGGPGHWQWCPPKTPKAPMSSGRRKPGRTMKGASTWPGHHRVSDPSHPTR